MIIKKKWTELLTVLEAGSILNEDNIVDLAEDIDDLMLEKFDITTHFRSITNYVDEAFFSTSEDDNLWGSLSIVMSSYAFGDKRFLLALMDKVKRYFAFYIKFISNDGLARRIATSRAYSDNSAGWEYKSNTHGDTNTGSNTENLIKSNTPNIELDNFEEGIAYASELGKNTTSSTDTNSGTAVDDNKSGYEGSGTVTETKTDTTWDEGMKNLRTQLFNELVDYVCELPNMLYNHYCTDTLPAGLMIKGMLEHIRNISEVIKL